MWSYFIKDFIVILRNVQLYIYNKDLIEFFKQYSDKIKFVLEIRV